MDNNFKVNGITNKQLRYNLNDKRNLISNYGTTYEKVENCKQSEFLKLLKEKIQDNQISQEKQKRK